MKRIISTTTAGVILLVVLSLLAVFHVLVLFNVMPPDVVWAGQFGDSPPNLVLMESISLVVTLLFILIVAVGAGFILKGKLKTVSKIGLWLIGAYFILNMIGNLASISLVENYIFAPLTLVLALLSFRLALGE